MSSNSLPGTGETCTTTAFQSRGPGHVFVVRGDARQIVCDAICFPSCGPKNPVWMAKGSPLQVRREQQQWVTTIDSLKKGERCAFVENSSDPFVWFTTGTGKQIKNVERSPSEGGAGASPPRCDVDTPKSDDASPAQGTDTIDSIDWYTEPVLQFVREAVAKFSADANAKPLNDRSKFLLATPVLGTGRGGAKFAAGEVIQRLLRRLNALVDVEGSIVDVVVVAFDQASYSAAQVARRGLDNKIHPLKHLPATLRPDAERISALARKGQLALFVGAGASIGAGLPSWWRLLSQLADFAINDGRLRPEEKEGLMKLPALDSAHVLEQRLGSDKLAEKLVDILNTDRVSLMTTLLATSGASCAVTTNYDPCIEMALKAAGIDHDVLPYDNADKDYYVLKMHGSVSSVEGRKDIVLTRESFLRYAETRSALAGIVQNLLVTKHMLFVGFSLQDENFHRIVSSVRKSVPANRKFATALVPERLLFADDLFPGISCVYGNHCDCNDPNHVDHVYDVVNKVSSQHVTFAEAVRNQEIFLDVVSLLTNGDSCQYLLRPEHESALTHEERQLRNAIVTFQETLESSAGALQAVGVDAVNEMLGRLGGGRLDASLATSSEGPDSVDGVGERKRKKSPLRGAH